MWGSLLAGILARPWARRVAAIALVALTITLFILNLCRTAERAGRAAERLDQLEQTDAIHRQMLDAAARRPRSRDDLLDRLRGGRVLTSRPAPARQLWNTATLSKRVSRRRCPRCRRGR